MNIKSKKGYALFILAFLISIYLVVGMATETAVTFYGRDVAREVLDARAYYYTIAGARYAGLVIERAPNSLPTGGLTIPLSGNELGGANNNFFTHLQLGIIDLDVTIEDLQTTPATYEVVSQCTY